MGLKLKLLRGPNGTHNVTQGPHYEADARMEVHEPY